MSAVDTLDGFLAAIGDELGLEATPDEAHLGLTELPRWDSLHLLRLVALMEDETGRRLPLAEILQARTLAQIHAVVVRQAQPQHTAEAQA